MGGHVCKSVAAVIWWEAQVWTAVLWGGKREQVHKRLEVERGNGSLAGSLCNSAVFFFSFFWDQEEWQEFHFIFPTVAVTRAF